MSVLASASLISPNGMTGLYAVDNHLGAREIPYHKIDTGSACGLFVIPPFGGTLLEPKSVALLRQSITANHDFLTLGYSGLHTAGRLYDDVCLRRWVNDARVVFEELTDKPQIIVASSFGANAALKLARLYPERIKGMILVAPGTDLEEHLVAPYLNRSEANQQRYAENGAFYAAVPHHTGSNLTIKRVLLRREHIDATKPEEVFREGGLITVPFKVTIFHDPEDKHVPFAASEELCGKIRTVFPDFKDRVPTPPTLVRSIFTGHDHHSSYAKWSLCAQVERLIDFHL
ncbi:MAG: alpha/beta fold hydrolase [Alphaproteobacteria bacterium]